MTKEASLKRFYVCQNHNYGYLSPRMVWMRLGNADAYTLCTLVLNCQTDWHILPKVHSKELLSPSNRKRLIPSDFDTYYKTMLIMVMKKLEIVPLGVYF